MQGPWNRLIYTSSTALTISLAHTSLGKILSQKLPAQNFLAQKISCPKTSHPKTFMPNTKHGMEQVDPNEQHQRPPSSLPLFRLTARCIQTKVHTFTSLPFFYTFILSHYNTYMTLSHLYLSCTLSYFHTFRVSHFHTFTLSQMQSY